MEIKDKGQESRLVSRVSKRQNLAATSYRKADFKARETFPMMRAVQQ